MTPKDGNLFARFAVENDKINQQRVHHKLFEPRKDGTLSVEAIDGQDCQSIAEKGKCVADERGKTLYGWAKVTRIVIETADLIVCVDSNPHPGHATIIGWPTDRNIRLDKQKILARDSCGVSLSACPTLT